MDIKRLVTQSWFYARLGYSTYLAYSVAILGYISAIYYLAIKNPILEKAFPDFSYFVALCFIAIPFLSIMFGWMHMKRAPFFKAEQQIAVEANPYSINKIPPVTIPSWKVISALAKKHGIDTHEMDEIIKNPERKSRVHVYEENKHDSR